MTAIKPIFNRKTKTFEPGEVVGNADVLLAYMGYFVYDDPKTALKELTSLHGSMLFDWHPDKRQSVIEWLEKEVWGG